jgi:hypothetical protein
VLLVHSRRNMAVLLEVPASLLHYCPMDAWNDCSVVSAR